MDFGFTKEQEKLRKEVKDFLINELPSDYQPGVFPCSEELVAFLREMERKVGEKGWLAPGWSKEYGGLGLSEIERGITHEETGYWDVHWPDNSGVRLAGPATFLFGTEAQKKKFLPGIGGGEVIWIQCFTEPDAGTDEANIQLRAVADGDDYVFNGQKCFITSQPIKPDYLYTEARTLDITPKHRGLTLFLIPADTPGITYNPVPCLGDTLTIEVFFEDVRMPKEYMLGELNRGFYHAMTTLEFERSGIDKPATLKRDLEEFIQFCRETKRNGKPLIDDPQIRDTLAQMAADIEVMRLASWRTTWRLSQRERLGPLDYDLGGFLNKILNAPIYEAMMNILGLYGQLETGSKWVQLAGSVERKWRVSRSMHPEGSNEALKIVLAGRGLGLPRRR